MDFIRAGIGLVPDAEVRVRDSRHDLDFHRTAERAQSADAGLDVEGGILPLKKFTPCLVVGVNDIRRGIILIDANDVARARAAFSKNLGHILKQPPGLAMRLRRAIERMAGLQHLRSERVNVVCSALPGREHPPPGAYPTSPSVGRIRNGHRENGSCCRAG
jgi:hypothetical protein